MFCAAAAPKANSGGGALVDGAGGFAALSDELGAAEGVELAPNGDAPDPKPPNALGVNVLAGLAAIASEVAVEVEVEVGAGVVDDVTVGTPNKPDGADGFASSPKGDGLPAPAVAPPNPEKGDGLGVSSLLFSSLGLLVAGAEASSFFPKILGTPNGILFNALFPNGDGPPLDTPPKGDGPPPPPNENGDGFGVSAVVSLVLSALCEEGAGIEKGEDVELELGTPPKPANSDVGAAEGAGAEKSFLTSVLLPFDVEAGAPNGDAPKGEVVAAVVPNGLAAAPKGLGFVPSTLGVDLFRSLADSGVTIPSTFFAPPKLHPTGTSRLMPLFAAHCAVSSPSPPASSSSSSSAVSRANLFGRSEADEGPGPGRREAEGACTAEVLVRPALRLDPPPFEGVVGEVVAVVVVGRRANGKTATATDEFEEAGSASSEIEPSGGKKLAAFFGDDDAGGGGGGKSGPARSTSALRAVVSTLSSFVPSSISASSSPADPSEAFSFSAAAARFAARPSNRSSSPFAPLPFIFCAWAWEPSSSERSISSDEVTACPFPVPLVGAIRAYGWTIRPALAPNFAFVEPPAVTPFADTDEGADTEEGAGTRILARCSCLNFLPWLQGIASSSAANTRSVFADE